MIPAKKVTITNPTKGLNKPFTDSDRETIARFIITAGEHDLLLKRIRLKDAEDVNDRNFSNFSLTAGSQQIGFLERINRNILDFRISDYFIEAEKSRTLSVRADISRADKDDRIRLFMDDPEHLYAFDFEFGFGVGLK